MKQTILQGAREVVVLVLLDPGVVLHLAQRHSVLGVNHEQLADEVLRLLAHVRGEAEIQLADALVRHVLRLRFEGRMAAQKLVGQHADAPVVDGRVVVLVIDHLGRQVIQGAAHGVTAVGRRVCRPAKIGDLRLVLQNDSSGQKSRRNR